MALISCPECKTQVSSFAKACPICGYPINSNIIPGEPSSNQQLGNCPDCGGRGEVRVACYKCGGSGEEYCQRCSGSREVFKNDDFSAPLVRCPKCHGSGKERCLRCNGSGDGFERCLSCDGTGQLTSEALATLQQKREEEERQRAEDQWQKQQEIARQQEQERKRAMEEQTRKNTEKERRHNIMTRRKKLGVCAFCGRPLSFKDKRNKSLWHNQCQADWDYEV